MQNTIQKKQNSKPEIQDSTAEVKPAILSPAYSVINQKMNLLDVISPQSVEVDFDYIKVNDVYFRTLLSEDTPGLLLLAGLSLL